MGFAILLYPKGGSRYKLAKNIWLIGAFGISHGVVEWIDMFFTIEQNKPLLLQGISLVLLALSYLFLLCFGLRMISEKLEKLPFFTLVAALSPLPLSILILIGQSSDPFLLGNILTRYCIGIPGIILSAYALYLRFEYLKKLKLPRIETAFKLLIASLLLYAVAAGIIVPDAHFFPASTLNYTTFENTFGFPVQLLRGVIALVAAYTVLELLSIFRHETETKLQKFAHAIEESDDNVVITDINGIVEYLNPSFEKHTGYQLETVRERKINFLRSGKHDDTFYEQMWNTLLSGECFRGHLVNKKKSGELYHEYKTIVPIKDRNNHIIYFVSTGKDITEFIKLEEQLEMLAATDSLTGIWNRMKFDEQLNYELTRAKRYDHPLGVILFDIDHFKNINDTYGHPEGDHVLKAIAAITQKSVRESDLFARWGGEEFILLLPYTTLEQASAFAERLRLEIEMFDFGQMGSITASFGVSAYYPDDTIDTVMKRVDAALYHAKNGGRNQIASL
jgi:diguanylate cyclase (GGDEF)-like protein/PAS domain S-box-containing protein